MQSVRHRLKLTGVLLIDQIQPLGASENLTLDRSSDADAADEDRYRVPIKRMLFCRATKQRSGGRSIKYSTRIFLTIVSCLLALVATSTRAAPLYYARAETSAGFPTVKQFQSSEAAFASTGVLFLTSGGVGTMDASSLAGPGRLHVSAKATINIPGSGLGGNGSVAAAEGRMVLEDIVISPLPGTTPGVTVPISLALTLSGSLDTLAQIGFPHSGLSQGGATISVSGVLAGALFCGVRQKISQAAASTGTVTNFEITGIGILTGSSSVVVTQEVAVPIDTAFSLDLRLSSVASASWNFGGTSTASTAASATAHASYFSDSLTLKTNG